MDSVSVRNAQGELMTINVVRFFRLNGAEYLLFSLNEIDEGGYVKLYICKVAGDNAYSITDDVEWNLIKDTIKDIIKMNKDTLPLSIADINVGKLNNIQITDQKVFKLSETFINLLGANKKVEATIEQTVAPQMAAEQTDVQNSEFVQPQQVQDITPAESISTVPAQDVAPIEPISETPVTEPQVPIEQPNSSVDNEVVTENPEANISDGMNDYALDYKTLYENEIAKNNQLVEQNQKYKDIIDNLRKTIEEAL